MNEKLKQLGNRTLRVLLGLLLPLVGAVPPFAFFMTGNTPAPDPGEVALGVGAGTALCLVAFVSSYFAFRRPMSKVLGGFAGSVLLLILAVIVGSALTGSLEENLGWLPVILFFGFIGMSPVLLLTWLGTHLMFGGRNSPPPLPKSPAPYR